MRPIVTLAATVGLALAPALAVAQGTQSQPAPANPIPDQEISKAGSALHDVAKLQQKYQPQMDSASPAQKQGLSEQANAEAVQAIQSHGLSVQEYSNVMRTAQTNPDVKQRLLQAARQGN
jgi:Domain of unknown function (DUF4168)